MSKPSRKTVVTYQEVDEYLDHSIKKSVRFEKAIGVVGLGISLVAGVLSNYVAAELTDSGAGIRITSSFWYFVGGILVLGLLILAIAKVIRWKNRDILILRRELSEIYLTALTKSAFNPQLGVTSK